MPELTPEAKAEIAEAVRIVREDKFTQYVRTTMEKHLPKPPEPPTNEPPKPPTGDPAPPPEPKPEDEPKPKKTGLWWGAGDDD